MKEALADSVEDYLELCARQGKAPQKPLTPTMRGEYAFSTAAKNPYMAAGVIHLIHYGNKPVHSIRKAWGKILSRAGIRRRIRPYDLRHAFATEALASGADIGTVAKIMGHASLTMVLKHYQHVLDSQKRAAAESVPAPVYVAEKTWHSVAPKTASQ